MLKGVGFNPTPYIFEVSIQCASLRTGYRFMALPSIIFMVSTN